MGRKVHSSTIAKTILTGVCISQVHLAVKKWQKFLVLAICEVKIVKKATFLDCNISLTNTILTGVTKILQLLNSIPFFFYILNSRDLRTLISRGIRISRNG